MFEFQQRKFQQTLDEWASKNILHWNPNKKEPKRFFSGGISEFEVSPTKSDNRNNIMGAGASHGVGTSHENNSTIITETIIPVTTKTVFLIRHAQSEENRRLASLGRSFKNLASFKIPEKDDVSASIELLDMAAQVDSNVSKEGRKQIDQLGNLLEKDDFVKNMGIKLVAHSPLIRARQTSEGMVGCVTPRTDDVTVEQDPSAVGCKVDSVNRVVEIPFLSERTPMEWLPINHDAYTKRIATFEQWLREQPEDIVAIIGHSQYFKNMLGMSFKFGNCDVWEVQFDNSIGSDHISIKSDVNSAERFEKRNKIVSEVKKNAEKITHGAEKITTSMRSLVNRSSKSTDDINDINDEDKRQEKKGETDFKANMNNDENPMENYSMDDDERGTSKLCSDGTYTGELPRGWSYLKRLHTYDSSRSQ